MLLFDGKPVEQKLFPNREIYLETAFLHDKDRNAEHTVGLAFEKNDDIIALLLLKGQMDDMGFKKVVLDAPFIPYSTMDHVDHPASRPLSLKHIAGLINSMGFERVRVAEPHSTVLTALLDRVGVVNMTELLMMEAVDDLPAGSKPIICFPDMGAMKRYEDAVGGKFPTLCFAKKRNFDDGKIQGMRCIDNMPEFDEHHVAVIMDDLCRGGYTFVLCAELLKEAGCKRVELCVTHMERGAFLGVLKEDSLVDKVYATNSCLPGERPEIKKLQLVNLWEGA